MKKVLVLFLACIMAFPVECKEVKKENELVLKLKAAGSKYLMYSYYLLAAVAAGDLVYNTDDLLSGDAPITSFLLESTKDVGCLGACLWAANRCSDYKKYYYGKLDGDIKDEELVEPENFEVDHSLEKKGLFGAGLLASSIALAPTVALYESLSGLCKEYNFVYGKPEHNYPFWSKSTNISKFIALPVALPLVVSSLKSWGPYSLKLFSELKNKFRKSDQSKSESKS